MNFLGICYHPTGDGIIEIVDVDGKVVGTMISVPLNTPPSEATLRAKGMIYRELYSRERMFADMIDIGGEG